MKFVLKNDKIKFSIGRFIGRGVILLFLITLIPLCYFLPRILVQGQAADFYCAEIFPAISFIPTAIMSIFMFSVTETIVVIGALTLPVLLVMFIVHCVKTLRRKGYKHLFHYIYKVLSVIALIGVTGALIFEGMHGINYNRTSVREKMHLYGDTRPYEDYEQTLLWAYCGMVDARNALGEDYNGVAHLMSSFESVVYDANIAVASFSDYYDLGLSNNYIRAKAVWLSRLWGYTDIVGMYDPFLGESNINTDYMDILHLPLTVCHEIAHAKGYANETDANTIAALSLINSKRADFRYAGYYYIFIHLWGTVNDYAFIEGIEPVDYTSQPEFAAVIRDMKAFDSYTYSFEQGPIADLISRFSEEANNAFLESNGQEGGTETYVVPQNVYVEYFCRYVRTDA